MSNQIKSHRVALTLSTADYTDLANTAKAQGTRPAVLARDLVKQGLRDLNFPK